MYGGWFVLEDWNRLTLNVVPKREREREGGRERGGGGEETDIQRERERERERERGGGGGRQTDRQTQSGFPLSRCAICVSRCNTHKSLLTKE